jgi:hypothetical protein
MVLGRLRTPRSLRFAHNRPVLNLKALRVVLGANLSRETAKRARWPGVSVLGATKKRGEAPPKAEASPRVFTTLW